MCVCVRVRVCVCVCVCVCDVVCKLNKLILAVTTVHNYYT